MKCWNGERRMYLVNVKLHSFTYINVHIISLSLFLHLFPSYARRPCGPSREAESRRANVRKSEGNALKRNIKEAAATEDDLARRAWPRRWRRPSLASRSCLVPPGGGGRTLRPLWQDGRTLALRTRGPGCPGAVTSGKFWSRTGLPNSLPFVSQFSQLPSWGPTDIHTWLPKIALLKLVLRTCT